jgi:hypothetical protein
MKPLQLIKFIFHVQTLLLIPIVVSLWLSIDSLYFSNIEESDLIPHSGKITEVYTLNTESKKDIQTYGKGNFLFLRLDNNPQQLFHMAVPVTSNLKNELTKQQQSGANLTLFIMPKMVKRLENNRSNYIEKMDVNGKTIKKFAPETSNKVGLTLFFIFLVTFLVSAFIYLSKAKKRYQRLKVSA